MIIVPVQPTLEMRSEEECTGTVEVVKPNESWEGEWNERGRLKKVIFYYWRGEGMLRIKMECAVLPIKLPA